MKPQASDRMEMAPPFDIEELRANIGNDAETEHALLSVFIESCSESLKLLREYFPERQDETYDQLWKKHMHQIKGAAMNLGASRLVQITGEAQDRFAAGPAEKEKLLSEAERLFADLHRYISRML